jgi:hypothetical protein
VTLPAGARIQATHNFGACQRAILEFMIEQNPATAAGRYEQLLAELRQVVQRLAWGPASGRPARFLAASSIQGRMLARQARELAARLGTPELREVILKRHVLLYAHSEREVFLLALKHERQLRYDLASLDTPIP